MGKSILTSHSKSIDISNLNPGVYFIEISLDDNEKFVNKFVKE